MTFVLPFEQTILLVGQFSNSLAVQKRLNMLSIIQGRAIQG